MGTSKTDIGTTTISIIATLAVWEVLIRIFHIPGFILPAPSAIFVEAMTRYQLYLYHLVTVNVLFLILNKQRNFHLLNLVYLMN